MDFLKCIEARIIKSKEVATKDCLRQHSGLDIHQQILISSLAVNETMKPPSFQGCVLSFLSGAFISLLGARAYQAYVKNCQNPRRSHRLMRDRLMLSGAITNNDPPRNNQEEDESSGLRDSNGKLMDSPELDYRLIRKAEAVIQGRTSRLIIVVERCTNDHNYSAILRTAEALGVQNLWIIDPPQPSSGEIDQRNRPVVRTATETAERVSHALFAQRAQEWLTLRTFGTTNECLIELRKQGYETWVTDLSQEAVPLNEIARGLRELDGIDNNANDDRRLAIVMGTEAVGCSQEMLQGADLRVYLPLVGFADSLNLSVATALVIQYIMEFVYPSCKHSMDEPERQELRERWYPKLARQRLLTPREKKDLKTLQKEIGDCQRIQEKHEQGGDLTDGQSAKLEKFPSYQEQLASLNADLDQKAYDSVKHLLENPPEPIGDLRRADVHRESYAGKGTKRNNQEHWKDMAAIAGAKPIRNSSRQYFQRAFDSNTSG